MPIFHAIVLGLVQGLSEFLPISSSGHLLLVPWLFGWNDFDDKSIEKAFDVALHLGTLIAAIVYFRHEVARYLRAGARAIVHRERPLATDGRIAWLLVLATIPAAAGRRRVPGLDRRAPRHADDHRHLADRVRPSSSAWPTACPARRDLDDMRTRDAVVVGAAQALSLNPGHVALGDHHHRRAVARLRPRLGRPAQLPDDDPGHRRCGRVQDGRAGRRRDPRRAAPCRCSSGIVTSGVSGWFAMWGLLRIVRTHSFMPFVVYRIVARRGRAADRGDRLALSAGRPHGRSSSTTSADAAASATAGAASAGTATSTRVGSAATTTASGARRHAAARHHHGVSRPAPLGTGSATGTASQPGGISARGPLAGGDVVRHHHLAGADRLAGDRVGVDDAEWRPRGTSGPGRCSTRVRPASAAPGAMSVAATTTAATVAPRGAGVVDALHRRHRQGRRRQRRGRRSRPTGSTVSGRAPDGCAHPRQRSSR